MIVLAGSKIVPKMVQALIQLLFIGFSFGISFAHTMNIVEDYKIEISWMKQPRAEVDNRIEVFVSWTAEEDKMMAKSMGQMKNMKMVNKIKYSNGIANLDNIRAELVRKGEKQNLEIIANSKIPGTYFSLVKPWIHGNYQINIFR